MDDQIKENQENKDFPEAESEQPKSKVDYGLPEAAPLETAGETKPQIGDAPQAQNKQEQQTFHSVISEPDEDGVRYYNLSGGKPNRSSRKGGKRSYKKAMLVFGIILAAVVLLGIIWNFAGNDDSGYGDIADEHIGVVYLNGVFQGEDSQVSGDSAYNHQWMLDTLDDMIENPENKGMVLYVDSPGGAVYHIDQVYRKLQEYKATGRPMYVFMGSMAASGGYYVSAPADKITADRNSIVGSIGVISGPFYDISGLLDKYGIKSTYIVSGKNKAMGSMTQSLTKEQREIYQSINDECYDNFVKVVAEGRELSEKTVRKLGDGRIYTAKQAQKNGLIDEIGTLEGTIDDLKSDYDLENCEVYEMKYENDDFFSKIWGKVNESLQLMENKSDLAAAMELAENQEMYPAYFMTYPNR